MSRQDGESGKRRRRKPLQKRQTPEGAHSPLPPPASPLSFERPPIPLVIAVVLTAVLEVLDITIVNVAIPHMLGAFGATPNQITWVLTSYIVAAAVVMPLTGYLSNWLGRRRLLLLAITGFILSSMACGAAWNLESIVFFRLLQGVFGAPLVPLSQAILLDAFPREKHGQALAIFGLGIMVAPVIGPALGGYLTELYSWRMVFYINIPIGIFALLLSVGFLPQRAIKDIRTDWIGMGLLVLAVGALQFVLDQGQMRDWFNSKVIVIGTIIAVFTTAAFFLRGWNKSDNIIDLTLLKDQNFVAGTLAITLYGISLFGWMAILPLFSQRLLGYPADVAGTLFIPRGIVSAITLAITGGILIKMFDARWLVAAGLVLTAVGTLLMSHFTLYVDYWGIASPGIIGGVGTGLFFVPLTAVAFASIPNGKYDEASGVYALMRGIGGSAGIAVVSWLFVRQTHIHFAELTAHITPFNENLVPYLAERGLTPYSPEAGPAVANELARQAQMLAFNDIFWFIGICTLAILPVLFFMAKPKKVVLVPAH
jgi:MFS transporter, DHA2 family, multidrug resistance protein